MYSPENMLPPVEVLKEHLDEDSLKLFIYEDSPVNVVVLPGTNRLNANINNLNHEDTTPIHKAAIFNVFKKINEAADKAGWEGDNSEESEDE